jgi:hypothetical protein
MFSRARDRREECAKQGGDNDPKDGDRDEYLEEGVTGLRMHAVGPSDRLSFQTR